MKLSIAWIFDHIDADWKKQDIDYLVEKFNKTSAEVEGFYKVKFDLKSFALCKIESQKGEKAEVSISEWKKEAILPVRDDSRFYIPTKDTSCFYLVKKSRTKVSWATLKDFDLDKDGLIPPLDANQKNLGGNWKKNFESEDIIFEVDNKSITHRPDMWGHRGFAREIATILDLKFLPSSKFLANKKVDTFAKSAKGTKTNPISIEIKAPKECRRFAGIYFSSIENKPSNFFITSRFLKVGVRPINGIVDLTNYLTLDWSQPVHAYDAAKIEGKKIIVRMAKKDEKMTLLDGSELQLTDKDLVIADAKKSLCLAGVMGGANSVVAPDTKSIFFESANFDAASVRRSAFRHGCRTESSMRFEKTLDPNQNIEGILRFLKLANEYGIKIDSADKILSVGVPAQEKTIQISHEFLEMRSGLSLKDYDVTVPLIRLGFKVVKELMQEKGERKIVYLITIPTFRGTKDVEIKEDVLEEIVRFYGFEKIELELPTLQKTPSDLSPMFKLRKIKNFLASCAGMMEQVNYVLYDEQFMQSIGLQNLEVAAQIINPVSQNLTKLVSSLIPGLSRNVQDNVVAQDSLRFFEVAKIWSRDGKKEHQGILEQTSLGGIFFEKRRKVNFYECKSYLTDLLNLGGIKDVVWRKLIPSRRGVAAPQGERDIAVPWANKYQTAQILFGDKKIGIAGKVDSMFLSKLDVLPESDAFFFELDADFLLGFVPEIKKMQPLPKYQETFFDLSMLVPLKLTTHKLEQTLSKVDKLVTKVELIDFFEKEEWLDQRSLAFRLWLNHPEKTLEKPQIETVRQHAIKASEKLGATLR